MKIAIIGGGITGLTTALALNKLGFSCQIFEKAPELNEVGAGIWMQPNAMKVLDWLGIGDQVRQAGHLIDAVEFTSQDLEPVRKLKRKHVVDKNHNQITSIHRARLQQVLFNALPAGTVIMGKPFTGFQIDKSSLKINFKEGYTKADLLLGADGIHSKVRAQLYPQSDTRYSGQTCWRGIAPFGLPKDRTNNGLEAWGRQIRFGFAPISKEEVYWYAVARAPQGQKEETEQVKQKLKSTFKNFHPLVMNILEHTPVEKIIRNDITDLKRLSRWHQNRVCLIGDAAHATTPNMGQGGGQGVEDAYYISNIIARKQDYHQAFALFEKERRKKVDYIVNTSWQFGQMAHNPIGQQLFKLMLKWTPESMMKKEMQKVYAIRKY